LTDSRLKDPSREKGLWKNWKPGQMKLYKIMDHGETILLSGNITAADSFLKKLFGLVFSAPLKESEGLLINNCSSIHTFWMRYPIDVIFLDSGNRVIKFFKDLKPFRVTPFIRGAIKTVELKSGSMKACPIGTGDCLKFV
jgi:uncharacterized membrane protein (UPF0127 family)